MADIIITENSLMAIYVAAALGGIRHGGKTIYTKDIPTSTEELNDMVMNGTKRFETTAERKKTFVTWIGENAYHESIAKEPPEVYSYKSYRLNKDVIRRITGGDKKNEKYDALYFALLDTEPNGITKNLIRKTVKAKEYYNLNIRQVSEDGIKKAYARAENYGNTEKETQMLQRDVHRVNTQNEIEKRLQQKDIHLDHYDLAAMFLIMKRDSIRQMKKTRYIIQAETHIHGIPCTVTGHQTHTKEEAEHRIREFPQMIVFDGQYVGGYLKTSSLFRKPCVSDDKDLQALLKSMYIKGYITNPITNSRMLPLSVTAEEEGQILEACVDWTGEELIERKKAIHALEKAKEKEQQVGAIMPCGTRGREHTPLNEQEREVYDMIVRQTNALIIENANDTFRFYAGKYPMFSKVKVEEIRKNLRAEENLPAVFSEVEEKGGKQFDHIMLREVFEMLDTMGIGNAGIYFEIYDRLKKEGLIEIKGNGGVCLTKRGEEVFSKVPVGIQFLTLCQKWEKDIDDIPYATWPTEAIGEFRDRLDQDKAVWNRAKGIREPARTEEVRTPAPQPEQEERKKEPEPEQKPEAKELPPKVLDEDQLICPICKEHSVSEKEDRYECSSCGLKVPKQFRYDGYQCSVTEKDMIALARTGRSGGKLFTSEDEGSLTAYIVVEGDSLDVTNQSNIRCPYCSDSLYIYDWGFGCEGCDLNVPFTLAGLTLPMREVGKLLQGKETGYIEGFKDKTGKPFKAKVRIEKTDSGYKLRLEKPKE